jgi:hypothetical protein
MAGAMGSGVARICGVVSRGLAAATGSAERRTSSTWEQTAHRARVPLEGTLPGSTRKTVSHLVHRTFIS